MSNDDVAEKKWTLRETMTLLEPMVGRRWDPGCIDTRCLFLSRVEQLFVALASTVSVAAALGEEQQALEVAKEILVVTAHRIQDEVSTGSGQYREIQAAAGMAPDAVN